MIRMHQGVKRCSWIVGVMLLLCAFPAWTQTQSAASNAPAAAAPPPAPAMDAPLNVKAAQPPSTDDLAKGDPGGTKTGTVNDVVVSDTKKGLTLADTVNQVGQNRIAINFVWTLVTGFLVMFMQAGFAIVETGLCRAKNANHTMMMNFMVYGFGLFAFWVCGFAIQMGGVRCRLEPGRHAPLNARVRLHALWQRLGAVGHARLFSEQDGRYDVGVMVLFLFQMVFMDTALTIVTGAAAERWKYSAFASRRSSWARSPIRCSPTGPGAAAGCRSLGANFGLGHGYCGLRRFRRRARRRGYHCARDGDDHWTPHRQVQPRRASRTRCRATTS